MGVFAREDFGGGKFFVVDGAWCMARGSQHAYGVVQCLVVLLQSKDLEFCLRLMPCRTVFDGFLLQQERVWT